jgi:hypothetical protein
MTPKLKVTPTRGGSRITLIGASGTELLSSKIFTEPRGKGATLRALKGLLGDGFAIEDLTSQSPRPTVAPARTARRVKTARVTSKPTARRRAPKSK